MNEVESNVNKAGMTGLILGLAGLVTCGFTSVFGVFFSLVGCFSSKPKGAALAGLCVSVPGAILFLVFGLPVSLALIASGINEASSGVTSEGIDPQEDMFEPQEP